MQLYFLPDILLIPYSTISQMRCQLSILSAAILLQCVYCQVRTSQFSYSSRRIVDLHNQYRRTTRYSAANMVKIGWSRTMVSRYFPTASSRELKIFRLKKLKEWLENAYSNIPLTVVMVKVMVRISGRHREWLMIHLM